MVCSAIAASQNHGAPDTTFRVQWSGQESHRTKPQSNCAIWWGTPATVRFHTGGRECRVSHTLRDSAHAFVGMRLLQACGGRAVVDPVCQCAKGPDKELTQGYVDCSSDYANEKHEESLADGHLFLEWKNERQGQSPDSEGDCIHVEDGSGNPGERPIWHVKQEPSPQPIGG